MDWRNKHFALDAVFPAPRDAVLAAGRTFAAESLPSWQHLPPEQARALADWRPAWKNRRSGFQLFMKLVVILWMINLAVLLVVLPLIGLIGGTFYLPLGGDGEITVSSPWGRVVSALILII